MTSWLPRQVDNTYRGQRLALWLFGLLLLVRGAMGLNSIFNGRSVASSADGIPLDRFTPAGAQTVVALFALLGLSRLVLTVIGVVVLLRYRTLVSFMFALFLLEQLSRYLIVQQIPIPRTGTPPGSAINLGILAVTVLGLTLSLLQRSHADQRARTMD
jgi:hypothetical protein